MPLALGFALAISSALGTNPSAVEATAPAPVPPQAQTVSEFVREYFSDIPVMADIAKCESHYRQFDKNGDVYRGKVNRQDVGVMQVNEHYHLDTTVKLGFDIYTIEGNTAYARYLYEREGTTPWASSQACWGKTKAAQKLLATVAK